MTEDLVIAEVVERFEGSYRWPLTCGACGCVVDVRARHLLARDPTRQLSDDDAFVCVLHPECEERYATHAMLA